MLLPVILSAAKDLIAICGTSLLATAMRSFAALRTTPGSLVSPRRPKRVAPTALTGGFDQFGESPDDARRRRRGVRRQVASVHRPREGRGGGADDHAAIALHLDHRQRPFGAAVGQEAEDAVDT